MPPTFVCTDKVLEIVLQSVNFDIYVFLTHSFNLQAQG